MRSLAEDLFGWIDVDQENLKGVVKELPTREQIDVPVNRDAYRRAVF